MDYWDTSAILKLYVAEHDSAFFLRLISGSEDIILSSAIVTTEVLCALFRKERAGDLKPGGTKAVYRRFTTDLRAGRVVTIPYGADVVAQVEQLMLAAFRQPEPVMALSLDAIHVASALAGKAERIVATDARLRQLAALAGLPLLP